MLSHAKVLCRLCERSYHHLDGTCTPHGMARNSQALLVSAESSLGVAALPRRLLATQYNVVGEGEVDEACCTSQVWRNLGGRLQREKAPHDRQDDTKVEELCTRVARSVREASCNPSPRFA
jgi:hypothetical protein